MFLLGFRAYVRGYVTLFSRPSGGPPVGGFRGLPWRGSGGACGGLARTTCATNAGPPINAFSGPTTREYLGLGLGLGATRTRDEYRQRKTVCTQTREHPGIFTEFQLYYTSTNRHLRPEWVEASQVRHEQQTVYSKQSTART